MSTDERVKKLKEEGNKLFAQKQYVAAAEKYTEALQLGGDNAVLYSNRAACRLKMKTYLDAESDATKATEIDPGFSKAYARLATAQDALRQPYRSIPSWKKALDKLPKEVLTPAQRNQREDEYEKGLTLAESALNKLRTSGGSHLIHAPSNQRDLPWFCAQRMIPDLMEQRNYTSSAWALANAYTEFAEGIRQLSLATTQGQLRFQSTSALMLISNAILTDHRVFHINGPEFLQRYNQQVLGEAQFFKAWTHEGPDIIKQKVLERLEEEGWHTTSPALTTTMRAWIMQGFYQGGLYQNHVAEVEFLGRTIEIIKWGRERFKDIRKEYRGVMFEETFLRGVQMLHLEALLKVIAKADDATLEATLQEANEVIAGVNAATIPPRDSNPAFVSAYYYKPKGQALSLKAMYHRVRANRMKAQNGSLSSSVMDKYSSASRYYLEAADCYAEDDENHAVFLNAGLEMMWSCKTSIRNQLAVMERIRLAIPKMKKIWGQSSFAKQGGDIIFKRGQDMEGIMREGLNKRKYQLDELVVIDAQR
ncbi:uncharacterized protein C8R40DRAFT_21713 [Lentinula edodes]|uniref:uncharacterized protein n=1 Tax=Lentinula edodes TaxID=5353 RepID=UPI001E8E039D|nr:uncharacterized protein C8R40DRAFT_21713 [Lentinula edodes]KAH7881164.1 hypothetical protein C8R40DRAFT_21713 [Lentinula edodes]